ncbi:hypothetical protein [Cupriavidus basilensis]|uniref:hypothetical protein n=1 Tax=Cupriavidus basilensis TaxID=68895 RepID=UPI0039F68E27
MKEFDLPRFGDVVSELTVHAVHRITEITRRDTPKVLNRLDTLFNDVDLFDGLNIVSSEHLSYDAIDSDLDFLPSQKTSSSIICVTLTTRTKNC